MESVDMGIDSTTHSINLNLNNAFENSKVLEHKESSKLILQNYEEETQTKFDGDQTDELY